MKYFPVFLNLQNQSAVVFGGGADAAAKLRLLQKTEARLLVVSQTLDADILDLGQATWVQADPLSFELPGDTALIYAATGDEALDAEIAQRAKDQGVLACAVDQMGPSSFITPAIVDRDPIVVAIGTEGTAPVLARDIKAKISDMLEPSLGAVARVAARLRPLVAKVTQPGGQRRTFWYDFFRKARAEPANATQIGHATLAQVHEPRAKLSFLHAPGPAHTLSVAARAALHTADVVIFANGTDPAVLELVRREALQIQRNAASTQHVAQALGQQQHVILIQQQAEPDDLSEVAAGFGVLAEVFPASSAPMPRTSKPADVFALAHAA